MNPMYVPGNSIATARLLAQRIAAARAYRGVRRPLATSSAMALRRYAAGAGADEYDPALQGVDPSFDPNVESGTGTKSAWDGGTQSGGGSLPAANSSVYSSSQVQVSTPSGVNMRDQPSTSGNVVAIEQNGTLLTVIGPQQNGWLHVQDPNGASGWVYSAYVSDASTVPASQQQQQQQGTARVPSQAPSILAGSTQAASSGLVGLAVVTGAVFAAKWLL